AAVSCEVGEADGRAQLLEPVDHALGGAVDGEVLQHLLEAHAPEPLASRVPRPDQERLADRAVEAQGARLRVLERGALTAGQVDRQEGADLAAAGVAGLTPRGVIGADVALELADARRSHRQENWQPPAPDGRVRLLGRRGDAERWVRLLVRLGHGADVAELEVLALVGEPVLRPRL